MKRNISDDQRKILKDAWLLFVCVLHFRFPIGSSFFFFFFRGGGGGGATCSCLSFHDEL